MIIKPEELSKNGYVLIDKLEHNELVPFIRIYIKKWNKFSIFYYLSNFILLGIVGFLFVYEYNLPDFSLGDSFNRFSNGLALAFALLPLHEYIHVLAYRSQGAIKTSFAANLKKFYFMALADKFVANKKEFLIVALAPFIFITSTLFFSLFFVSSNWYLTIFSILLTHTAMCSGDFGLLSYFEFNKNKQIVTYDDVDNKISYFYGVNYK